MSQDLAPTFVNVQALQLFAEAKTQRRRRSRVASLINRLLRYNEELFKAVLNEDETKIRQLREKGVDIDVKDIQKRTAVHLAVEKNYGSMVQLLLKIGAEIEKMDGVGYTARPHTDTRRWCSCC